MFTFSLASHFFFALVLLLVSAVISLCLIKRTRIMDIPNGRSSHKKPTPTIGGLPLWLPFFWACWYSICLQEKQWSQNDFFWDSPFPVFLLLVCLCMMISKKTVLHPPCHPCYCRSCGDGIWNHHSPDGFSSWVDFSRQSFTGFFGIFCHLLVDIGHD